MAEFDLQDVLSECRAAAKVGYDLANAQYRYLHDTVSDSENTIDNTLEKISASTCYLTETTESLTEQLQEVRSDLDRLSFAFKEDLQTLKDNLEKFSITLFGKTMTGKSTLMEILIHGDGMSIGKGAQRTTRDIRYYDWNGLQITDVPGVCAFGDGGEEDKQIAFEAAKKADLILFLITDDGPQPAEADCFESILKLGKPVICIMNVKAAVTEGKSAKLALRDIEKKFDFNRLNAIRDQFYEYAEKTGQDWRSIPFVYVHLKSAFLAQHTSDKSVADSYLKASRIENLEKVIINQVRLKGKYYRIKTFVDAISVPMLTSMENLLAQSLINSTQGRTILEKKRKLESWKQKFESSSGSQIRACIMQIRTELYAEIGEFAEDHYDDPRAESAWENVLWDRGIEERCQDVLKNLEDECNDAISEISREMISELNYVSSPFFRNRILRGITIVDTRKMWNWSTIAIGGGLSIGSIISGCFEAAIAPKLALAAFAVGVIDNMK